MISLARNEVVSVSSVSVFSCCKYYTVYEEAIVFEGGIEAFFCTSTFGTSVGCLVNGTLLQESYPMGLQLKQLE